ncbi:hypothetical protein [Hyalangium versicolor]|uniref:hypothetical protein n=1 Tax=Hyalangium versicolor TaxID=2861190 RepID=UPI001CCF6080|nr:hypothetical protein [Hyalangium versicolor]
MRGEWLGLVAVAAVLLSCGGEGEPPSQSLQFRVGGTVSGLDGNLTLQLNSGENLTLSQNGYFLFETPVDDGNPYRVTITTAPPEQVCTLKAATGRIGGADVDSVQVLCVVRTYALGGHADGATGSITLRLESGDNGDTGESLVFLAPGDFTFQTRLSRGSEYTASIEVQPRGFRCTMTGASGTVQGNVPSITVHCTPWYAFSAYQPASLVIGQSDFSGYIENHAEGIGSRGMKFPSGNPLFVNGKLYIPDSGNNRILGYNALPTQNDQSADFFVGQIDRYTHSQSAGPKGLSAPLDIALEGQEMVVADRGNNRIAIYNKPPEQTFSPVNLVIGQPDYINISPRCDARSVVNPAGVALTPEKLIVPDAGNNRLLIWNKHPDALNEEADLVLGQPDLITCNRDYSTGDGTTTPPPANPPSATTFNRPQGIWTDGVRLVVADTGNHRVLIWNSLPSSGSQPPDVVLGQPDFTSNTHDTTRTGMSSPTNVTSTGVQLAVSDWGNHRVLIWNQFPTTNGALPDAVLGQADFTSNYVGEPVTCPENPSPEDPLCVAGNRPNARTLHSPTGLLMLPPYLLVADTDNHRVLIYESQ